MAELKSLRELKNRLDKHFIIDDWMAVNLIMATTASHKLAGEMLWVRVIGASGSGKTELLRSLAVQEDYCETMEALTPSSIRRGYNPQGKGTLPRLLDRIDGKLVITKELAPLLTKAKDEKVQVFGLLRSVHDGTLDADYGSEEGHIRQKTHFDWLLASTSYIDRQSQLEAQLGNRFIDIRWGSPIDRRAVVDKAMFNDPELPSIRAEIAESVSKVIADSDAGKSKDIAGVDREHLIDLAVVVSRLRTPVLRDSRNEVTDLPSPEVPTRLGQAFARLSKGLSMLGIPNNKAHLIRLAWDCTPPMRALVVGLLLKGKTTRSDIAKEVDFSEVTVGRIIEDLQLVNILKKHSLEPEDDSISGLSLMRQHLYPQLDLPISVEEYQSSRSP